MEVLTEARDRVGKVLLSLVSGGREFTSETVVATVNGNPLHAEDLFILLKATKPKERKAPSMKSAERRLKRNDPETSFYAAVSTTPALSKEMYNNIYNVLHSNQAISGLTDEELIRVLTTQLKHKYTPSGVRSRRAELVEAGWVKDSEKRRKTVSGRQSIVWAATVDS